MTWAEHDLGDRLNKSHDGHDGWCFGNDPSSVHVHAFFLSPMDVQSTLKYGFACPLDPLCPLLG